MRHSRVAIEQELRRRICDGTYAPGARLPLRRKLLVEFGASPLTMQRAMDRLAEQGFVRAKGVLGTFVAERLPNRGCIALVFPSEPERSGGLRFWSAIQRAAAGWDGAGGATFRPYFLNDSHLDVPDHRRLCADLADGGLAGVLSVNDPHYLIGSPVLESPLPRVCIGNGQAGTIERYRASFIHLKDDLVQDAVLRRFHTEGRRRVAILTNSAQDERAWLAKLKEVGLKTRPEWWIALHASAAEGARPITRLLCSGPADKRPDCLLISDDNLVLHAAAGILDARLHMPQDLRVAAHANFPYPTHAPFPCLRFGVDVVALLHAAVGEIFRLASGGKPGIVTVSQQIHEQAIG